MTQKKQYDYELDETSPLRSAKRLPLICEDSSRTKQSFARDSDINYLMERYAETGQLDLTRQANAIYGDFTNQLDYQTSLNIVIAAQANFDALSPYVRARFSNDPAQLLAFIDDSSNRTEAIKLGLIDAPSIEQATLLAELDKKLAPLEPKPSEIKTT